ncbi:hypothetical protein [Burkholderia multivorans]|uniref:hypothetical protein n=1 Tax=Burkholderia multivorans TaxID=87883 RepID=UPI00201963F9|nr:hypothetical protein [Burkholderia multivorans]MCO1368663.1 hypothetical protein [Burkholderia multivorans]MCO1380554.1 hypothetical protein [Burkholderia multivorans]MDN8032081.1 hypothetical protein [Burkholderia multivorans]UQP22019.1 hypothetical protein L0Y98_17895 [Burkholderia multivorans]UQP91533.1 hypothetical protein L0Y91_29375 [Burkholderia multivorans]
MTNLVMLLIAMHGGGQPTAPTYRYAVTTQAVASKRSPMKMDAAIRKDGQLRTFPAGRRNPCI